MTQELSTLMDGELEGPEAQRAIGGCCGNEELRRTWEAYHAIGDAMRGDGPCRRAARERILAALAAEPTVLAPRRWTTASAGRIAFAAAASLATVAVVGWIGLQDQQAPAPVVAKAPAAPAVMPVAQVTDYLAVHRQVPNAEFIRPASNQVIAR